MRILHVILYLLRWRCYTKYLAISSALDRASVYASAAAANRIKQFGWVFLFFFLV